MYRTMRAFVMHETALAAATGYNTISMAGAIALGLLGATSLVQIITAVRRTFFTKIESKE
ncbi:MAG: hypothetical protein II983_05160, partial [Firmicutes bacterium]|nr:hypothetical protein [Bacillota bacterium]